MREPIFFAYTRSFLAGVLPLVLILIDVAVQLVADPAAGPPVAALIARLAGWNVAEVEATMRALAPVFGLIIAQQRAGAARPYSIDPRAK